MGVHVTMSSKGQVVIPKDVRDALGLKPGEQLSLRHVGRRIILEASDEPGERITYEEFRRRVPRHQGPVVAIKDMTTAIDELYRDWKA